jgi:hypothetical protein
MPGRIIGVNCLPASLAGLCGLRDIRGYDGVDPARFVDLLALAADPRSTRHRYALTQWMAPKASMGPEGELQLAPVLDMLGVRYVIGRGIPPEKPHPAFQGPDYWVLVNSNALPRAFVPRWVQTVAEDRTRLPKLGAKQFDPRETAYVEVPIDLPGPCRGTAEIVAEIPTRMLLAVHTETPGLVVVAELWDQGWQAFLNGRPAPILRTNHAIRGVLVPAGSSTLELRYAPASFTRGLRLAALAAIILTVWLGITRFAQGSEQQAEPIRPFNGA